MSTEIPPGVLQLQGVFKALTAQPAAKLRVIEILDRELERCYDLAKLNEKIYLYDVIDQLRALLIAQIKDFTREGIGNGTD